MAVKAEGSSIFTPKVLRTEPITVKVEKKLKERMTAVSKRLEVLGVEHEFDYQGILENTLIESVTKAERELDKLERDTGKSSTTRDASRPTS